MPIIQIHLLEGRTDEQKENLIAEVTQAVSSTINAPASAVHVIISEMNKQDYGLNGESAKKAGR